MKSLTKNSSELLKIFFTNPDKFFYMQEIGRILGKKPGVFQRTLNNMVSEGILEDEYKANLRYFHVNKKYTIYKELKNIIFKTVGIKGSIEKILREFNDIKFAFIYGSYAKSKENYQSDIDLMIIGKVDEYRLMSKLDKLEKKLQREINYKLYTLKEFTKDIAEKESFIEGVLKDKKIMMIGDENALRKIFSR